MVTCTIVTAIVTAIISFIVSRQLLCPVRIASNRNHTTWYRYASSQ